VQPSPSLHVVPSAAVGFEQEPLAGSQTPATWHWSSGWQTTALPPVQTPLRQRSVWVQAFPSLHVELSGFVGFEQTPVLTSQTPGTWH
jgi:hypothetical protein